jgi:hypothetical protein
MRTWEKNKTRLGPCLASHQRWRSFIILFFFLGVALPFSLCFFFGSVSRDPCLPSSYSSEARQPEIPALSGAGTKTLPYSLPRKNLPTSAMRMYPDRPPISGCIANDVICVCSSEAVLDFQVCGSPFRSHSTDSLMATQPRSPPQKAGEPGNMQTKIDGPDKSPSRGCENHNSKDLHWDGMGFRVRAVMQCLLV